MAYDIQKNKSSQSLKKEEMQVAIVEREQQIVIQDREIARREKELDATVKRQADAERYRVETEASALKNKAEQLAKGNAEATRLKGMAKADVITATGSSEDNIIALKGEAEAEAMRKRADAFKEDNQAAVLQSLLAALPEIAKVIPEPLSKTDRITLVSTGSEGTGASRLTGDVAKIMAEMPAVAKSFSGVDIRRLIESIPVLQTGREAKKTSKAGQVKASGRKKSREG